jgi:thiol-disulfide isomerase/thioredoxin
LRAITRARVAGAVLIGAIALAIALGGLAVGRGCGGLRPPRAGQEAPGFALHRIDEGGRVVAERVSLESLRGRVVVIDFWATWCQPCRQSMPAIGASVAKRGDRVMLLSVCTDGFDQPAHARALVDELAPAGLLLADRGEVADRYGVTTIPHLVVLSADGRIVAVESRYTGAAKLRKVLDAALDEALAP